MPLTWKRVIDSQAEKLKELDKEIRPFRQNWEEADSMKSSVESLQNRVTELESVDKSSGQAARNTGEGGRTGAGMGLGGTWTQVSAVARTRGVRGPFSTQCLRAGPPGYGRSVCQANSLSAPVPLAGTNGPAGTCPRPAPRDGSRGSGPAGRVCMKAQGSACDRQAGRAPPAPPTHV